MDPERYSDEHPSRGVTITPVVGGGGYTYETDPAGNPPQTDSGTLIRTGPNTYLWTSAENGGTGIVQFDDSSKVWGWQTNSGGPGGTMVPN